MVLLVGRTMTLSDSMIGCSTARPNDRVDKSYSLQFLDIKYMGIYHIRDNISRYRYYNKGKNKSGNAYSSLNNRELRSQIIPRNDVKGGIYLIIDYSFGIDHYLYFQSKILSLTLKVLTSMKYQIGHGNSLQLCYVYSINL